MAPDKTVDEMRRAAPELARRLMLQFRVVPRDAVRDAREDANGAGGKDGGGIDAA